MSRCPTTIDFMNYQNNLYRVGSAEYELHQAAKKWDVVGVSAEKGLTVSEARMVVDELAALAHEFQETDSVD